jgi:hypothetical protein
MSAIVRQPHVGRKIQVEAAQHACGDKPANCVRQALPAQCNLRKRLRRSEHVTERAVEPTRKSGPGDRSKRFLCSSKEQGRGDVRWLSSSQPTP